MKETVFGALHMIQSTGAGERGKEILKHAHKDYLFHTETAICALLFLRLCSNPCLS